MIDKYDVLCLNGNSKSERKTMAETLTAPVVDPSEFTPEELDEIRDREQAIDEQLDTFLASGADTEEAFKGITQSLERQAVADPKTFLAAREKLSTLTEEDDPTDEQLDKEEILKDVIDGPLHVRTVTKYGVFAPPTAEVRAKVERAIESVRDAESVEGKTARRISSMNANSANLQSYGNALANLSHAREAGDTTNIEIYGAAVRNLRKSMDIQSRGTGYTQKELDAVDKWIDDMRAHDPDITDDDPHMKDALQQRAEAQEDLEKVQSIVGKMPVASARERLRNLLKEHPEGIDVVHQLEATHSNHATSEDAQKKLLKAREAHEAQVAEVARLQRTLDPGDARIAIAQIEAYPLEQAYRKALRHTEVDTKNADLLTELADENALDKIALEDHEAAFGKLVDLEGAATESLLEWKKSKRPIDEHGSYVAIKKIEDYLAGVDEKIALADKSDRFLPHYRQLRSEALDSYLQVQYSKEFVRTKMFAEAGDFEGRYALAHDADKGIVIERADGDFIIYPDGSYCSLYSEMDADGVTPLIDSRGNPVMRRTPRVDAYGELVTTPVLEQIPDPRALIEPATLRAWDAMTTENLLTVNDILYKKWIENPANPSARAQLEVMSGMIRERTFDDGTTQSMEATYIELYLGVGRDGNADRLDPEGKGSVLAHMTLYDIEGDWAIHANGAADLYTPGVSEPVSRYAADGTILNAYGPEDDPSRTSEPEDGDEPDDSDDGSGAGGGTGAPSTPMPSAPAGPARPTPPATGRPRPGAVGGVRRPSSSATPEAATPDSSADNEPGTVSAGGAPTPPTPPTPEGGAAAPKSPSEKEREARQARVKAVEAAKNRTIITTSIAPRPGTIAPRGEYEGGKSYVPIIGKTTFGDGANNYTEYRTREELWGKADEVAKHISPETFYISPVSVVEQIGDSDDYAEKVQTVTMPDGTKEELYRIQYRFDADRAGVSYPTAGDNSYPEGNVLVVDTELPKTAALGMVDAFSQNAASVRDFARDLYAQNIENGAEIWDEQGGHPPYDKLPADWRISIVMPGVTDGVEVVNRPVRR